MRSAQQALERVTALVHTTGYYWIIEGDISKFFDTINHTVLLKKLYHMGIKDRRVLMIIKQMLKAGIMNELRENPLGTPQGGIISPLLANAYLHPFDNWCSKQWESKGTKHNYSVKYNRIQALKSSSNLKPGYLVRYADDWVLITNSRNNAEKWKWQISRYLKDELRLSLSEQKTMITDVRKKSIHFLGFEFKVTKGNGPKGYITNTKPDAERTQKKVKEIHSFIKNTKQNLPSNRIVHRISLINSKIRGIIQYHQATTGVNVRLNKYAHILTYAGYKALKPYGGKWTPAKHVNNLMSVHQNYNAQIPAIKLENMLVGITSLGFCKFKACSKKNQIETSYTIEGRAMHREKTGKIPLAARIEALYIDFNVQIIAFNNSHRRYNFEYYLNRAYAYNRDKGKCRVCGEVVLPSELHTHHINGELPKSQVNKVVNLASTHVYCHKQIHDNSDPAQYSEKIAIRIRGFREKLS